MYMYCLELLQIKKNKRMENHLLSNSNEQEIRQRSHVRSENGFFKFYIDDLNFFLYML